jgi:hypothetical protein
MADLSATSNAVALTVNATAATVARGIRLALNSSGTVAAAASTVRGDYVAAQAAAASATLSAFQIASGGIVPMVNSGATIAVGDTVYSAASGKIGTTSTSTVIIGKAMQASSTDGELLEVLINNPL